jgi:hypothetical protein
MDEKGQMSGAKAARAKAIKQEESVAANTRVMTRETWRLHSSQ